VIVAQNIGFEVAPVLVASGVALGSDAFGPASAVDVDAVLMVGGDRDLGSQVAQVQVLALVGQPPTPPRLVSHQANDSSLLGALLKALKIF